MRYEYARLTVPGISTKANGTAADYLGKRFDAVGTRPLMRCMTTTSTNFMISSHRQGAGGKAQLNFSTISYAIPPFKDRLYRLISGTNQLQLDGSAKWIKLDDPRSAVIPYYPQLAARAVSSTPEKSWCTETSNFTSYFFYGQRSKTIR